MEVLDISSAIGQENRYVYARYTTTIAAAGTGTLCIDARQFAMVWVNGGWLGEASIKATTYSGFE